MQNKRIVLSGGPSSGKTTLINELGKRHEYCFQEVSRELIQESQKKGIEQPFLTHPEEFNRSILQRRLDQFNAAKSISKPHVFYDRGIPEVIAYMDYGKQPIPEQFLVACKTHVYDTVFLLPPWEKIHIQDDERYETFEQANSIYESIKKVYVNHGYSFLEVPFGTVKDRVAFILNNCE